jgi:lipopolysaccharide/colanic/teichoic acid biosynthesis glycosyltransferase
MKRMSDILCGGLALILLLPLLLILAIAIRCSMGRPVLFRQTRAGINGTPFEVIKFRTMKTTSTVQSDADRLTNFGRFLRSTSLDELPELWCILRGDMSFVGPRPLLMEYLPLYTKEQARRHDVRPGLTGWAQINGRNSLNWEEKFKLDVWYVDNQSLLLDMKIMVLTAVKVFQRDGISANGEATMPKFQGSRLP